MGKRKEVDKFKTCRQIFGYIQEGIGSLQVPQEGLQTGNLATKGESPGPGGNRDTEGLSYKRMDIDCPLPVDLLGHLVCSAQSLPSSLARYLPCLHHLSSSELVPPATTSPGPCTFFCPFPLAWSTPTWVPHLPLWFTGRISPSFCHSTALSEWKSPTCLPVQLFLCNLITKTFTEMNMYLSLD